MPFCRYVTVLNIAHFSGGEVVHPPREYGRANLNFIKENEVFFEGVAAQTVKFDESIR
jgi:hypothetical protein